MIKSLGIVGHEQAKFEDWAEARAREEMEDYVLRNSVQRIISGHSPLGGVDIWAEELAENLGLELKVYAPTVYRWDGPGGFKERNLQIANNSDLVLCVVVEKLPESFKGMRFNECYHCKGRNSTHVKSGGCWTAWKCRQQDWIIV